MAADKGQASANTEAIKRIDGHLDAISSIKLKLMPVVVLMEFLADVNPRIAETLTKEELGGLAYLIKDLLDEVFENVESIDDIYRQELRG